MSMFIKTCLREEKKKKKKAGYKMQHIHTIKMTFSSCTENILNANKMPTWFSEIPYCVTHCLSHVSTAKHELRVLHQVLLAILHWNREPKRPDEIHKFSPENYNVISNGKI